METDESTRNGERLTTLDRKIEQFERVLESDPEDISTLMAYGEANLLRGRLLDAMKSYQRLAVLQPGAVDTSVALGRVYLDSGLFADATRVVSGVLESAPENIEGQLLLRRLVKAVNTNATQAAPNGGGGLVEQLEQPLQRFRDFLPPQDALTTERARLDAEIVCLNSEVADLEAVVASNGNDPAVEFVLEMTRARRGRAEDALSEVTDWEGRIQELQERQRQEEEARKRDEQARQEREEEAARQRAAEEEAERLQREDEERQRQEAEEARRREEEERLRLEQVAAEQQAEADERRRVEEEAAVQSAASSRSRERTDSYASLAPALESIRANLMKTKGVASVLVVARDGMTVCKTLREDLEEARLCQFLSSAVRVLDATGEGGGLGKWQFWVLEYAGGILVVQRVSADYYLVVVGQAGANFGVLTWTIEKSKAQLEAVLAGAPPVPPDDAA